MKNNIVLVGFMGCGKSTVGKLVAEQLHFTFCDTDTLVEQRENTTVSEIFADKGEQYFRTLERTVISEISAENGLVIATGGGAVMNPENAENLRKTGFVVFLDITPEAVLKRLENDTTRPLLMREDKASAVTELIAKRKPFYTNVAHVVINAENDLDATAKQIIELYIKNRSKS